MSSSFGALVDTRLRVMTWNLWWRFGPWEQRRPAIAATLAAVDADIVCLQEVWGGRDGEFAAELAQKLGFQHASAARLDYEGVTFGNAVLSRWPIAHSDSRPLPTLEENDELRTVLHALVDGPRGPIQVFTTHLNWRFDHSAVRQAQVRLVAEWVAAAGPRTFPPVLCGDLNAPPDSDEIRMLTGKAAVAVPKLVFYDAWEVAGTGGAGVTWSNANPHARGDLEPDRRIDYILVGWPKTGGVGQVLSCRVAGREPVDGMVPSDHYAVVAELRY